MSPTFTKSLRLDCSADEAFAWHNTPHAFMRLAPPWERIELLEHSRGVANGGRAVFKVKMGGPAWLKWTAEFKDYAEGRRFCDDQVRGPFAKWTHTHSFLPEPDGGSTMRDSIVYKMPMGPLGDFFGGPMARTALKRMFHYRHGLTKGDLAAHARSGLRKGRTVLVTGSSGLVGKALVSYLITGGHMVTRLVRPNSEASRLPSRRRGEERIVWDPYQGFDEDGMREIDGFHSVVHLAGRNVGQGLRWSEEDKVQMRLSRSVGTLRLCEALAKLPRKPKVLVCASAVGYYGNSGDEEFDEKGAPGSNFLAQVCREWEAATQPAVDAGIRVVRLRIGVVLSPNGGALQKMLPAFQAGLGGRAGNGRQWMSWISLDDTLDIILRCLADETLEGPVNAAAPNPVRNAEFADALARVLERPALLPLPALAARGVFGEMAEETILASHRVRPAKLLDAGHPFRHERLEDCLRHALGLPREA